MNPLQNVGANASLQKIYSKPIQKQIPADAPKPLRATDRLELSGMSNLLKTLKVAGIKDQIEAGTYDKDGKKLDASLNKLLDDLLK